MEENKSIEKAEGKVIAIRNQNVILDSDVAELYGVETRTVNQAVKRNIERFPIDYMFELTAEEYENLKSQNVMSSWGGSRHVPKAFTEKGLYMLATVLKSPMAKEATFAIIETFAKIRVLARGIEQVNYNAAQGLAPADGEDKKLQNLMTEVLTNNLPMKIRKIGFSLNLGIVKFSVESTFEKSK